VHPSGPRKVLAPSAPAAGGHSGEIFATWDPQPPTRRIGEEYAELKERLPLPSAPNVLRPMSDVRLTQDHIVNEPRRHRLRVHWPSPRAQQHAWAAGRSFRSRLCPGPTRCHRSSPQTQRRTSRDRCHVGQEPSPGLLDPVLDGHRTGWPSFRPKLTGTRSRPTRGPCRRSSPPGCECSPPRLC